MPIEKEAVVPKRVYVLRHGVTSSNGRPGYIGGIEPELEILPAGKNQLDDAARRLSAIDHEILRIKKFHVSPTTRAKQSAMVLAESLGMKVAYVEDKRLIEVDMGEFTGKMRKDVFTPEVLRAMDEQGENFRPPGGTSRADLGKAMFDWLESLTEPKTIAVSHVNAIRALIHRVMGVHALDSRRLDVRNGGITVFEKTRDQWIFSGLNW